DDGDALGDGANANLVEGAQGGFHVWMAIAARDLPPGDWAMLRTAHRVSDGALVLRIPGHLQVDPPGPGGVWRAPAPPPLFLCPAPIGIGVVGEPIRFQVALTDDAGAPLTDGEIVLTPFCPAAQEQFCARICNG